MEVPRELARAVLLDTVNKNAELDLGRKPRSTRERREAWLGVVNRVLGQCVHEHRTARWAACYPGEALPARSPHEDAMWARVWVAGLSGGPKRHKPALELQPEALGRGTLFDALAALRGEEAERALGALWDELVLLFFEVKNAKETGGAGGASGEGEGKGDCGSVELVRFRFLSEVLVLAVDGAALVQEVDCALSAKPGRWWARFGSIAPLWIMRSAPLDCVRLLVEEDFTKRNAQPIVLLESEDGNGEDEDDEEDVEDDDEDEDDDDDEGKS